MQSLMTVPYEAQRHTEGKPCRSQWPGHCVGRVWRRGGTFSGALFAMLGCAGAVGLTVRFSIVRAGRPAMLATEFSFVRTGSE